MFSKTWLKSVLTTFLYYSEMLNIWENGKKHKSQKMIENSLMK